MIGAIIMVHGDDQGLVLPPRIAPIQVVLIPIYKNDAEKVRRNGGRPSRVFEELKAAGVRAKLDDREEVTPGFKFNDWELRGVPLRIEIGPKDVEKNSVALARRDVAGKGNKIVCSAGRARRCRHATCCRRSSPPCSPRDRLSGRQHPRST